MIEFNGYVEFKSLKAKPVSLADLLIAEVVNAFLPLSKIKDIEQLKWLCCELGLKFPLHGSHDEISILPNGFNARHIQRFKNKKGLIAK